MRLVSWTLKNSIKILQSPFLKNIIGEKTFLTSTHFSTFIYLFCVFRVYPALCLAVGNFVIDRTEATGHSQQDYSVSFVDVATRFNVRELTTAKIGELVRISGQVIRTHPVHPELVSGHFTCQDCQTDVPSVEQQFKVSHIDNII